MPPIRTEMKSIRIRDRVTSFDNLPTTNPSLESLLSELHHFDVSKRLKVGEWRAGGGYADVYEGELKLRKQDDGGKEREFTKVAVKRLRVLMNADSSCTRRISRELKVLAKVKHRNIVHFRGFALVNNVPAFVSDWIDGGTLNKYLARNEQVDEMFLATEIAEGLKYLHSNGIVHSDLKSDNILIRQDGVPLLSDFGISRIVENSITVTGTSSLNGNARWMSIELFDPSILEDSNRNHELHTKRSDVWAYGMVVYAILTKGVPFKALNEIQAMLAIISNKLPKKPENATIARLDELWDVCERCWRVNPRERPKMEFILRMLEGPLVELSEISEFEAHIDVISHVAFSPVDARILATASYDRFIRIWTLSEDRKTSTLRHQLTDHALTVESIAWSSDGLFLVSGSFNGKIRKWNTSSGVCELTMETPDWVFAIALSPDNKRILSGGQTIYVWDSSSGQIAFGPLQAHSTVYSVAYSPNGQYFVSGSEDGLVIIWDSPTGTIHSVPFKPHSKKIDSIAFHPTSETFATALNDGAVIVWDANTFESIRKFPIMNTTNWMRPIQYSPNGRSILSTSWHQIDVLDTQTGKTLGKSSDDYVNVAAFSPDGRWVASGSRQGGVKIWEFLEYDT